MAKQLSFKWKRVLARKFGSASLWNNSRTFAVFDAEKIQHQKRLKFFIFSSQNFSDGLSPVESSIMTKNVKIRVYFI